MILKTIQHIKAVGALRAGETYYALPSEAPNRIEPYRIMQKHYKYEHTPVFACVQGKYSNFYGAMTSPEHILLTLNAPDDQVKLQSYYNWSDIIYFMEFPNEWNNKDIPFSNFIKDTLDGTNIRSCSAIQATLPYIRPEWLMTVKPLTEKFLQNYYGNGGNRIL